MKKVIVIAAALGVAALGGACGKKDDGTKDKKIGELNTQLAKANEREATLKDELTKLTKRVTRLQNDFKIYSQKPCDYELDAIEYSIQRKDGMAIARPGMGSGMASSGMTVAMAPPRPKGPPAELKDVKTKARQARRGIKRCYQNALKKNNALQEGSRRVTLKFTVQPTGRMAQIMVIPPIGSGFEPCVRSLLRKWHFSKFKGPAQRFRLPMTLRPQ